MWIEGRRDRARSEGPAKRGVDPQILRRSPDEGAAQYPRRESEKNSLVLSVNSTQTGVAEPRKAFALVSVNVLGVVTRSRYER
jgi:hypothetical protein